VQKHSNADKLQVAKCFGNQIVVSLDYKENDLGIYFPSGGKLGKEFAEANNLLRKKDENGNNVGGFIDPDKRNVRAIRLRGEASDGLFLPISCLDKFTNTSKLKEGETITVLNGTVICEKYIPKRKSGGGKGGSSSASQKKKELLTTKYPYFEEHIDTKQLMYYLGEFNPGDICTITLKLHGTSARTSNTLCKEESKKTLLQRITRKPAETKTSWGRVSGSRRVTLDFDGIDSPSDGYYGNNEFRKRWHDEMAYKLHKGEEIFYEIVGYVDKDTLIMPQGKNSKIGDPEFIKQYGEITEFTYGCEPGWSDVWVYRMTKTDEDGRTVEYPDWYMRMRCEQMGLKCVPKFDEFIYTTQEDLLERVNKYVDGPDPIGQTHIREGVVIRIQNREKFKAFKIKNFSFKCISGIALENIIDNGTCDNVDVDLIEEM